MVGQEVRLAGVMTFREDRKPVLHTMVVRKLAGLVGKGTMEIGADLMPVVGDAQSLMKAMIPLVLTNSGETALTDLTPVVAHLLDQKTNEHLFDFPVALSAPSDWDHEIAPGQTEKISVQKSGHTHPILEKEQIKRLCGRSVYARVKIVDADGGRYTIKTEAADFLCLM